MLANSIKISVFPLFLAWLLVADPLTVWAVRRQTRSVLVCDQVEPIFVALGQNGYCRDYCNQVYIKPRGLLSVNQGLSQTHVRDKYTGEILDLSVQKVVGERDVECCCIFEAPWPDFVNPSAIGRIQDEAAMKQKSKHTLTTCLPLTMGTIFLSARTRKSYETLCKYLDVTKPMTVLELMRFAEAAKFLNFMQPKHPSIALLLRQKNIRLIQKDEYRELGDAFYDYLLDDSYMRTSWPEYPGYHLNGKCFKKILDTRDKLKLALRSKYIDRAVDELAISQVLVDIRAASVRLQMMNQSVFKIPKNLLEGNYDKYFLDLENYFKLPGLDCKLLTEFTGQVELYLSQMKSLLYTLHEKLVFDHMTRNNMDMKQISSSINIYKHLLEVNCK